MDSTLTRAKRTNKRRQERHFKAWQRFSPDGTTCRFCRHDHTQHLCTSAQPHFYRPATEAERRDPRVMLYRTHQHRQRLGAGQTSDGGETHRDRHRFLYRVCRGCGHQPGALLPA